MSVIIRLQNLPWSANSLDIRQYFRGLSIPEGGVHIVGGEMGDAFIAFSTDEDARQAMMLAGGKIKEVQISLMLSSRSEMQKIIEAARQASMSNSLAQLLAPPAVALGVISQQPQPLPLSQVQHHQFFGKEARDPRNERKDSSDMSSSSHETTIRRDRRDRSRSRSRDKSSRRERRDRDRDRRRKSKSRSRSRDRRRRRSRSRSRGRDSHARDKERKDSKDEMRKDTAGTGPEEAGPTLPTLEVPGSGWNVLQTGQITQNASLLNNFELLRNLASQQGPLIPAGPSSLLLNSMTLEKNEGSSSERFPNKSNSPLLGDYPGQGNFGNRNPADPRLNNQRLFNEGNFQDKFGTGGGRFDVIRGPKPFQNFNSGFLARNGGKSRFGNFGRGDDGILSRPSGPHQERSNLSRGLLDYPRNTPPRESRTQIGHQDRFNNRDDGVDEFGRSIQLRNRKNAASENSFKEDNDFQGNHQNFNAFGNRFSTVQTNRRGLSNMRSGDNYQDRRGFRGSFEDSRGSFRSKSREGYGKFDDELAEKDCCVEIRNLAPHIAYGEVRRPFSNAKLIIKEIKFFDYSQNDKKCRVRFLNSENKRKAIQLSTKIQIDNKQVNLLEISDKEFEECVDEGVKRPEVKFSDDEEDAALSPKDVYLQIKDLSLNIKESDIAKLFPNATLDKIILEVCEDGKTKTAYIKFQKAVDAKVALGTPNRTIGDCIAFLTPLPQYVFNDVFNKNPTVNSTKRDSPDIMEVEVLNSTEENSLNKNDLSNSCILMKNLPLEANDRDICDFFSDVGLVPNKIHLMLDTEGQPLGDAFCEFSQAGQIERACTKNSAHLGKNIVSVTQVPRREMLEALGLVQGATEAKNSNKPLREDIRSRNHCVVAVENIPFRAGPLDIINFFGWSYKLSEGDILRRYNERGQPTGDAKVCFKTSEDAQRAVRFFNNKSLMGRAVRMKIL